MLANFWTTLFWLGLIHFLQKFTATAFLKQYIGGSEGSENRWTFEEKNILMVIGIFYLLFLVPRIF